MSKAISEQIADLKNAIAAQEGLRALVGDGVVDATIAALQQKLAELQSLAPKAGQQRKLVTILFSDVKGSTAMAEKIDPEQWAEIMNQAFEYLINPVNRHGGMIARLMGDAILAFFGAQAVHENDPQQAILAGLEIVEGIRPLREQVKATYGLDFGVRVGINSGPVLLGQVGTEIASEFTAMGDTINLAARMEQNAPVNGVLIAHDTYRLTRGLFAVNPQPPLLVKGKEQPVQTYLVERALPREQRSSARGLEGVQTPLIGRDQELAQLRQAFCTCLERRQPTWVTILGEAGMGKSRLTAEFLQSTSAAQVFSCAPSEDMAGVPFSALRDLFRRRFQILDDDPPALAQDKFEAGMIAYLDHPQAHLVGHWIGFDFSRTQAVQDLLGSAAFGDAARLHLGQYFRGLAADFPLLLVLDDLHWADEASIGFLTDLFDGLQGLPFFVLALARPSLNERLPGCAAAVCIRLASISRENSLALVEKILQQAGPLPPALSALILFQAGGNPYYIEEIIKMLIEEQLIRPGEANWQANAGAALPSIRVPRSLEGVIQARLDALSDEEKQILQRASIFPLEFWDDAICQLEPSDAGVQPALKMLLRRGLIVPNLHSSFSDVREYVFKHHILRKATYETVLLKLRKQYHQQAAIWLEQHVGERLAEYQGKIAEHYARAGCNQQAAEYLLKIGVSAYQMSAYPAALAAIERALSLTPEENLLQRIPLIFWLGQVQEKMGLFVQAREHDLWVIHQGQALPEMLTYAAQAAQALSWILTMQGKREEAAQHAEMACRWAAEVGDPLLMVRTRAQRLPFLDLPPEQELAEMHAVLNEFETLGKKPFVAVTWLNIGIFEFTRRNDPAAAEAYQNGLEIYRQIGHKWGEANCFGNLGLVLKRQGDLPGALRHQEEYRRIALEISDQEGVAISASNLGYIWVKLGSPAKALAYLQEALAICLRDEMLFVLLGVLNGLVYLHLAQGRAERAAEILGALIAHPVLDTESRHDLEDTLADLRPSLSADVLQAALARGQALNFEQMVHDEAFLYGE